MQAEDTVAILTVRSPQRILREGGSQAWVLSPVRAKQCTWLVCAQNRHHVDHVFEEGAQPHGAAFLIGRISGLRRSEEVHPTERWLITINEYAFIDVPGIWKGWRNPVRYTSLAVLGIDPSTLSFTALAEVASPPAPAPAAAPVTRPASGLTLAGAKRALAVSLGVAETAIEITIRV